MPEILSAARSVGAVLIIANLLIVCHELGHLWVARSFGVRAKRFSIGLGPRLGQRIDRHGTVWSLSLLPLGGLVAFDGEREPTGTTSYGSKPVLQRMAIVAAGPAANVLVAMLTFAIMLAIFGKPGHLPNIETISTGSAAERSGFRLGDRLVAIGSKPIHAMEDVQPELRDHPDQVLIFTVERAGSLIVLSAKLDRVLESGKPIGLLGITSRTPFRQRLSAAEIATGAVTKTWDAMADTVHGVATVLASGQGADNIAGVVGIAQITSQAAEAGPAPLLALVAILSANLALMNLLPIPVLDGGALLFCLAELLLGRPLPARIYDVGTRAGVFVLISLFMFTTANDVLQSGLLEWLAKQ